MTPDGHLSSIAILTIRRSRWPPACRVTGSNSCRCWGKSWPIWRSMVARRCHHFLSCRRPAYRPWLSGTGECFCLNRRRWHGGLFGRVGKKTPRGRGNVCRLAGAKPLAAEKSQWVTVVVRSSIWMTFSGDFCRAPPARGSRRATFDDQNSGRVVVGSKSVVRIGGVAAMQMAAENQIHPQPIETLQGRRRAVASCFRSLSGEGAKW